MTPAVFIPQPDPRSTLMTSQPLSPESSRKPTSREAAKGPRVLTIPGPTVGESESDVFLDDVADEGKARWRYAVDGSQPAAVQGAPALKPLSLTVVQGAPALKPLSLTAVQRASLGTNVASREGHSTRASTDRRSLAARLVTPHGGDATHTPSGSKRPTVSLAASEDLRIMSDVPKCDRVVQPVDRNLRDSARTPAARGSLNSSVGEREDDLATMPREVRTEHSQSKGPEPDVTRRPPLEAETYAMAMSRDSLTDTQMRAETAAKDSSVPGDCNEYTEPTIMVESKAGTEIVSVLKRTDSRRHRTDSGRHSTKTSSASGQICRQHSVTLLEPCQSSCQSCSGHRSSPDGPQCHVNVGTSYTEMRLPSASTSREATEEDTPPPARRRISFPMDSVLTAVIQDRDTPELLRILSGRGGPGLVGRTGEVREVVQQRNHAGLTALHHAVLANNLDAAKLLLCHGAAINAQDVHGFSPLHTAAACGYLPLASLLILYGGDVFCLTAEQELPIDVAKDLRLVRLLGQEMERVVQGELWLPALVLHGAGRAWMLCRHLLVSLLLLLLHLCLRMRHVWRTRRKTD